MQKQNEFMTTQSTEHQFPAAPPSYDEAVFKQPAYNPYLAQGGGYEPVAMQSSPQPIVQHIQPVQPQPVIAAVMYPQQPRACAVGPKAANMSCPHCQQQIKTNTTSECQKSAHISAILCCIFGCYLCCWIPYCMSSCRNVHHRCPRCSSFIGTYKG